METTDAHHPYAAVTSAERVRLMGHEPGVIWLAGLSGAGKSTLAGAVAVRLHVSGIHAAALDGGDLRLGLAQDLGVSLDDRTENIRRAAHVARLMGDAGLIVLCAFISPLRAERATEPAVRPPDRFLEVFVDMPRRSCIARDPKGPCRRAPAGEIRDCTGIDQVHEAPDAPDVVVGRDGEGVETAVAKVMNALSARGVLAPGWAGGARGERRGVPRPA